MEALAIAALLVLPGAWVAFALRDGAAGFGVRLAWAMALSPLIVAGEFFLARRAAGSFPQTAWLIAALNFPAVILIWRRWRARIPAIYESSEWEMWRGMLLYAALAGCAILPWWMDPGFRTFSTHGLLQLDVIYAIATTGAPWEAELAGAPLTYPWAPHVAWAVEAAAAQRSPTILYPLNNLLLLGACGLFAYELARTLGASKAVATAATAVAALGTDLPTPLLAQFVEFDAGPLGLALVLGLALASVLLARRPRKQEMLLLAAGLVALAALDPRLYPAGAALALAAVAALGLRARRDEGLRIPAIDVAGWAAAGLVTGYFVLHAYGEGRWSSLFELTRLDELGAKAVDALLLVGPLAAAAALSWRVKAEKRVELGSLSLGAAGACLVYLALHMGGDAERGLLSAAGMLFVAPALIGLCVCFSGIKRRVGWITWGAVVAVAVGMGAFVKERLAKGGQDLAVDERSFFLSLDQRNPQSRWMAAVRVKTDPELVLVVNRPDIHVSAFTARRLFIGAEGGAHAGCNQKAAFRLTELRGHDPEIVERRLKLAERVYSGRGGSDELLDALAAETGPELAFVFLEGDDRSFLEWLRRERHVRVIYDDGVRTVVAP